MCKDLSYIDGKIIAHRGLYNESLKIPENSILAFDMAVKRGYPVELDVHLLKDGNIAVFHDDNLLRMTGVDKKIKLATYDEIKDLNLNGTEHKVPLLKDVLKVISGKVPIIIELKYDTKVGMLENKLMELLNGYKGKVALESFNPLSILYIKIKYPYIVRGQISCNFKKEKMNFFSKIILKSMVMNIITKPDFISYDICSLPNKKIERYRKNHLVIAWTIKNREDLDLARKYADSFISENIL